MPIRASPGEFVVNAAAARRNRALPEAINAGAPASPQGGGVTGGSGGAGRAEPLTLAVDVDVHPSGEFDTRVQATARDVSVRVVDEYDRPIAPRTFRRIRDDPRRTGGGSPIRPSPDTPGLLRAQTARDGGSDGVRTDSGHACFTLPGTGRRAETPPDSRVSPMPEPRRPPLGNIADVLDAPELTDAPPRGAPWPRASPSSAARSAPTRSAST